MVVIASAAAARRCAAALLLLLAATLGAQAADAKTYVMKISIATVGDAFHQFAKDYAAAVKKDSGGRIEPQVYPASELGSIEQQAEGVQFGAIQCQIVPPEFLSGIDERFEVLTAPDLVTSVAAGERLAANPAVRALMLGLGTGKGLHGAALFMVSPSVVVSIDPIRRLADFRGKKIRIFASQFQSVAMRRLGAVPKAMTLGGVRPALQDNALDGAISSLSVLSPMRFQQVARYATEIGQPAIFGIVELSERWYQSLPADLKEIVDRDAAAETTVIAPWVGDFNGRARQSWTAGGGQLLEFPPQQQATMLHILASVGADVSKPKPRLAAAYKIVTDAAK